MFINTDKSSCNRLTNKKLLPRSNDQGSMQQMLTTPFDTLLFLSNR